MNLADAIDVQADLKRRLVEWLEHDDPNKVTPVKVHSRTSEDMTLIEYAKLWFVHIDQSGRKRPHVVDIDIRRAEVHILPLLGQIHISDIGKPELYPRAGFALIVDGQGHATTKSKRRTLCEGNAQICLALVVVDVARCGAAGRHSELFAKQYALQSEGTDDSGQRHPDS